MNIRIIIKATKYSLLKVDIQTQLCNRYKCGLFQIKTFLKDCIQNKNFSCKEAV